MPHGTAHNAVTQEARARFLAHLRVTGNVSASAREAGHDRRVIYRLRESDEDFAAAWDDAIDEATDALEAEARRRAAEGWQEPVFFKGVEVGTITKYSDSLLTQLLKAHSPKFKDRVALDHGGQADNPVKAEVSRAPKTVEEAREVVDILREAGALDA